MLVVELVLLLLCSGHEVGGDSRGTVIGEKWGQHFS